MAFDLKGKTALITGAASGIGLAYATELLKNGLQYVTIADLDTVKGEEAVTKINKELGSKRAIFVKCDVTNVTEFEAAFKTTISTWKSLDILINNAGIMNDAHWEKEIAINCNAVVRGTLFAFKYMGKDQAGHGGIVVNIASILGLQPLSGCPIYVASKHFVVGLNRSFGTPHHFNKTGVKILTMCPGVTDTPLISEAGKRILSNDLSSVVEQELAKFPSQKVDNVARGMITLITKGENGSVWVSEGNQPIYEMNFPERTTLRKQ